MKAKIESEQFRMESKLALFLNIKINATIELNSNWNKHEQLQRRHDHYVRYAIPSAQEIVRNTKTAYGAGEISYLEYLTALGTATEVEAQCIGINPCVEFQFYSKFSVCRAIKCKTIQLINCETALYYWIVINLKA